MYLLFFVMIIVDGDVSFDYNVAFDLLFMIALQSSRLRNKFRKSDGHVWNVIDLIYFIAYLLRVFSSEKSNDIIWQHNILY